MNQPDNWLSAFFDRDIVQVKVNAKDFDQIAQLQKQGFSFVEGEIEFELDLTQISLLNTNQTSNCLEQSATFLESSTACKIANQNDLIELQSLFGSAFSTSRFRPPYFSLKENQQLYQTWIINAVNGEFDHICLIKRSEKGQLQGGITLRLGENQQVKIGLLAVSPSFQQQGIGKILLNAAVIWASQQNRTKLKIVTQSSNIYAIRLYQHIGAKIKAIYYWFYPER